MSCAAYKLKEESISSQRKPPRQTAFSSADRLSGQRKGLYVKVTVTAESKNEKKFLSEDFKKDFPTYPVGILFMG